ncbi:uncharacterized protein SCDLUD_005252 [Saccharomycodes ludwigii]|uniref:uncharacterized protein n=1 Tax=Saccharomycodes ludwigii TaxID=36035 RepID=UPI001E83903F|nr:hypothetical protein SCDLUD_005252 [Saccharomycodes ludwigii]KAH3898908.1 hypothetical protein SCDLUD_005252 [Saccharomycodes ludwigii]
MSNLSDLLTSNKNNDSASNNINNNTSIVDHAAGIKASDNIISKKPISTVASAKSRRRGRGKSIKPIHPVTITPITPGATPTCTSITSNDNTKVYPCLQCKNTQRTFSRLEHLQRHIRSFHTDLKPYKCGKCYKEFVRKDLVQRHLKKIHKLLTLDLQNEHIISVELRNSITAKKIETDSNDASSSTSSSSGSSSISSATDSGSGINNCNNIEMVPITPSSSITNLAMLGNKSSIYHGTTSSTIKLTPFLKEYKKFLMKLFNEFFTIEILKVVEKNHVLINKRLAALLLTVESATDKTVFFKFGSKTNNNKKMVKNYFILALTFGIIHSATADVTANNNTTRYITDAIISTLINKSNKKIIDSLILVSYEIKYNFFDHQYYDTLNNILYQLLLSNNTSITTTSSMTPLQYTLIFHNLEDPQQAMQLWKPRDTNYYYSVDLMYFKMLSDVNEINENDLLQLWEVYSSSADSLNNLDGFDRLFSVNSVYKLTDIGGLPNFPVIPDYYSVDGDGFGVWNLEYYLRILWLTINCVPNNNSNRLILIKHIGVLVLYNILLTTPVVEQQEDNFDFNNNVQAIQAIKHFMNHSTIGNGFFNWNVLMTELSSNTIPILAQIWNDFYPLKHFSGGIMNKFQQVVNYFHNFLGNNSSTGFGSIVNTNSNSRYGNRKNSICSNSSISSSPSVIFPSLFANTTSSVISDSSTVNSFTAPAFGGNSGNDHTSPGSSNFSSNNGSSTKVYSFLPNIASRLSNSPAYDSPSPGGGEPQSTGITANNISNHNSSSNFLNAPPASPSNSITLSPIITSSHQLVTVEDETEEGSLKLDRSATPTIYNKSFTNNKNSAGNLLSIRSSSLGGIGNNEGVKINSSFINNGGAGTSTSNTTTSATPILPPLIMTAPISNTTNNSIANGNNHFDGFYHAQQQNRYQYFNTNSVISPPFIGNSNNNLFTSNNNNSSISTATNVTSASNTANDNTNNKKGKGSFSSKNLQTIRY